jgi:hypothetical protein
MDMAREVAEALQHMRGERARRVTIRVLALQLSPKRANFDFSSHLCKESYAPREIAR